MKPFISTTFFGALSYLIAFTMIASPWLFKFVDVSSAALLIPMYVGWLQFIMAVFSDNKTSMIRQFPIQTHLAIDMLMGFIVVVSPWLYTFSDKIFLPQLIFGLVLMGLALFTKKSPFTTKPHRPLPEGQLTSTASTEGRLSI
jgi:hypothetical protein